MWKKLLGSYTFVSFLSHDVQGYATINISERVTMAAGKASFKS